MDKQLIDSQECRKLMMDILIDIHRFCNKNCINYSLSGGTLLGAVRHKGFIPWDDDIDIMMPRKDYDRFIESYNCSNKNFECITCAHTSSYNCSKTFAKVHDKRTVVSELEMANKDVYGVFVDVFPIDGMPKSLLVYKFQLFLYRQIESIIRIGNVDWNRIPSFSAKTKKSLGLIISRNVLYRINNFLLSYFKYEDSEYAGVICGSYGLRERLKRSIFDRYVMLDFAGHAFNAIADYDTYLKKLYGNYMEIPSVENRKNHNMKAYRIR